MVSGKEAKFCPSCGEPLVGIGRGQEKKQGKGKRGLLLIVGGLLALVVGFSMLSGGEEPASPEPPETTPLVAEDPPAEGDQSGIGESLLLTAAHVEGASPVCAGDTVKGALKSDGEGVLTFEIFSKTYPLQITSEQGQPIEASFVSEVVEVFLILETSDPTNPRGVFEFRDYDTGVAVTGVLEPETDAGE
jgi:hypothetical protein